jgi:hypothetical protein
LVVDLLSSKDEAPELQRERNRLEEKLRRLKRLYREVEIEEGDYRQEVALTQAKLSGMGNPEHHQVVNLGDNVEGVVAAWEIATKEERREMLQMMLDAVYIDMTTKEVVGLKPKAAFLPLFNLDEPVKAGEAVLATSLTAGALDSTSARDTRLLLPSGISVFGIESWMRKLAVLSIVEGAPAVLPSYQAKRTLFQPESKGVLNRPVDFLLLNIQRPFIRTYSSSSIPARHMA